ncbi:EscF/YscF/HrpA family type III secretion system needle major subunit [Alsobacter sp. SYSU M60028]|uniref:EscF/YscF/HrpA family type III secretion system needle major subunit n=1 Tax=Alsobacter ponti TaxID=2962936 RepID=A0ABT1LDF5_9HYPH|nr:EscF/YscF/HrpA family type III secretion system needle major subunit [Alsobacter ponti]MCP8939542.1 EscF/YscF/HrpA family type III secretion system needle major subunit [Alsobacter ponti]
MASTTAVYDTGVTGTTTAPPSPFTYGDGFDLALRQTYLRDLMKTTEDQIRGLEQNANMSDTEKMFAMQMTLNTWSAISNLRTNMLKSVADTLKSIARNVS